MFEGRIAGTSDVWDATLITHSSEVEGAFWECCGCTAPLDAVAWKPDKRWLVTAHFRLKGGIKHAPGCLYEEYLRGGAKRIRGAIGCRVAPRALLAVVDVFAASPPLMRSPAAVRPTPFAPPLALRQIGGTRRSIAAVAAAHGSGVASGTPLHVRGVPELARRTYGFVFSRVGRNAPTLSEQRIWFGELRALQTIEIVEDEISVDFAVGCASGGSDRPRQVSIKIDCRGWSDFQRRVFLDRLRNAVQDAAKERASQRRGTRMYVLGARGPDGPCQISIDHPRRFAFVKGSKLANPVGRPQA